MAPRSADRSGSLLTTRRWSGPYDPRPNNIADVPIADQTPQNWDLHHLGGEGRIENADRLRDAILDGSLMTAR